MGILSLPPGAFLVNQVKIAQIYDETSRLSENKDGVLFLDGIDEKKRATADAEIPEGNGNDAYASPFTGNPLDKKSPEKEALADKAEYEHIIIEAVMNHVVESE